MFRRKNEEALPVTKAVHISGGYLYFEVRGFSQSQVADIISEIRGFGGKITSTTSGSIYAVIEPKWGERDSVPNALKEVLKTPGWTLG